ncbi:MAG TPA: Uma2 family endonuclease, partial [Anditalea sp.]|nr:Uma2 family endonuclease [Anditalea sp.]
AGLPTGEGCRYTYADYLSWQMEEKVELIKGKIFRQAAALRVNHQRVSVIVVTSLFNFLKGKKCEVFAAPFDVRLPVKSKKHEDIDTVVQPDICVICDSNKLDELGCVGAPDLVVEILSPGNNSKELLHKYEVYEESGVREYWVIQPSGHTLLVYTLVNGKFVPSRLFTHGDVVNSDVIEGFSLDLEEVFRNV